MGVESQAPIWKSVVLGTEKVEAVLAVMVLPAVTVTEELATLSSPWYRICVYVPAFISGEAKLPFESAYAQYCAAVLVQCSTVWNFELSTPEALPFTEPRAEGAVQPLRPRSPMKERSVLADGTPEREKMREYGPWRPIR